MGMKNPCGSLQRIHRGVSNHLLSRIWTPEADIESSKNERLGQNGV